MAGGRSRVWAEVGELDAWRDKQVSPPPEVKTARPVWVAIAVILVAAAAALIGISARQATSAVADAVHDGRQIIARDANGRLVWTHSFGNLRTVTFGAFSHPKPVLVDLDGDGSVEVLAHNPAKPGSGADNGVFCFDSSGRILWRFQPGKAVRTAQGLFEPPYHAVKVEPFRSREGGPWRIAVISVHHLYFPSQVAVLDERGRLLREYWHAGHLHDLVAGDMDRDGKPELYTAGLSNGHRNAVAIALDPERMEGAGWEDSDDYRFQSMQPGVEIVRWLTPRTALSRRLTKFNWNSNVELAGSQILIVGREYDWTPELALCLTFGPRLSAPQWAPCDCFVSGLQRAKAQGVATNETVESEVRAATGFRDITWRTQEAAQRRTTERPATR